MSYHRIYVAVDIEDRFKEEKNKSGLINELLRNHYDPPNAPSEPNIINVEEVILEEQADWGA